MVTFSPRRREAYLGFIKICKAFLITMSVVGCEAFYYAFLYRDATISSIDLQTFILKTIIYVMTGLVFCSLFIQMIKNVIANTPKRLSP
jgi:hypothetical protein